MCYVNFLRSQQSAKMGEYFTYPITKDERIVEKHQIYKTLTARTLRRDRFQFPFCQN